jgi:hypothetical protein
MKHLKLRASIIPNSELATVTVVEQTHGGTTFCCLEGNINSHPWNTPVMGSDTLWICDEPGIEFPILREQWPRIKKLVKAYNEWGATQP